MPHSRDFIGQRGENIVRDLLTRLHRRNSPLFYPQFLGDKYPAIDFFVELIGAPPTLKPYFLVQAKATTLGYTTRERRLRAQVNETEMRSLVAYPAPTHIIGIDADETREGAYLLAAIAGGVSRLSSFPTSYPLDREDILLQLYAEVLAFWQNRDFIFDTSHFV